MTGLRTRGPEALEALVSAIEAAALPDAAFRAVPLVPLPNLRLPGQLTVEGEVAGLEAHPGQGELATACPVDGDDLDLLRALTASPDVGSAVEGLTRDALDTAWLDRVRELAGRGLLMSGRAGAPAQMVWSLLLRLVHRILSSPQSAFDSLVARSRAGISRQTACLPRTERVASPQR